MEIAELVLKYFDVLVWPLVTLVVLFHFKQEFQELFKKVLKSHELEIDVLGQRVKLKALEKLANEAAISHKIEDAGETQHENDFLALNFARIVSQLSTKEVMFMRHVARAMGDEGYVGCTSERLVLEKFEDLSLLQRNNKGFYIPTEQGKKLLYTIKNL
ncbi:hypothetical protein [Enterovibrio norvegicus]|uniref:Uncharacterized protein n=1 Tax=Enterovibrio norvegicus DSM 15893 TaxID=1121869 RepID=A0A1I5VI60_9GAMM|nr:hypothetical protein [Enterovibrio norvegicus]SFQ07195.1 hypothetical protein SAMN03084138_03963 [Enterovibrio norvegicus DSM 15893]